MKWPIKKIFVAFENHNSQIKQGFKYQSFKK
jgi:hypothetical protein